MAEQKNQIIIINKQRTTQKNRRALAIKRFPFLGNFSLDRFQEIKSIISYLKRDD
jgi:hypothetical protein